MKWNNAAEAYWWIIAHPKLQGAGYHDPWIELTPHMVCDEGYIHQNPNRNVHLGWWIEFGPYVEVQEPWMDKPEWVSSHDWECDTGGNTAEEAVSNLAQLVLNKYGDY